LQQLQCDFYHLIVTCMHKLPVFKRSARLACLLAAAGGLSISGFAFAQTNAATSLPVSVPLGSLAEMGVLNSTYGTGVSGAASFMGDNFGIRLAADSAGKSDHVLGALGIAVNNQGYLVVGGSSGKEPLSGFDTQVKGSSAFVRLDLTNLTPVVRKLFIEVINKKADGKLLSVTDAPFTTVSTQDLGSVIRTITVNGVVRTTISFSGGSSNSVSLGGEANVGSDGLVIIKLVQVRDDKGGETSSKTHAWAGYKQYFPQYNASASVGADTAGRLAISTEKGFEGTGLGINLAGFKNTKGAKDYGVLFGLNYAFGGNTQNLGKRPDSNSMQLAETLKSFSTLSDHAVRNIEGLGKIVKTVETISSEKVNDVEKPKPIPIPIPNPNTAPTAVSLATLMALTADMTASGQAVGKISCVDYAPTGAQNTCTFSGGTSQFAVAADGTVTFISTSALKSFTSKALDSFLPAGSYSIPVVATDAAGLTYSNTVVVVVGAERPFPTFSIDRASLGNFCSGQNGFSVQLTYSSNSDGAVTWTSSQPTIISVSATGLITRVNGSTVQITANQAATSTYREASSVITVACRG
jgi:Bacterial Ig-like domain (group 2)